MENLVFIKDYINNKHDDEYVEFKDLAAHLGISVQMISAYRLQGYNPSLAVAIRVYLLDKIVLHPFAESSLQKEIKKGKR